jgi:hypothetical protein
MTIQTLNPIQRFNRIAFGAVLIGITMATSTTPLGWLAVLPLLAVLPIISGLIGFDPVSSLAAEIFGRLQSSFKSGTKHSNVHGLSH